MDLQLYVKSGRTVGYGKVRFTNTGGYAGDWGRSGLVT